MKVPMFDLAEFIRELDVLPNDEWARVLDVTIDEVQAGELHRRLTTWLAHVKSIDRNPGRIQHNHSAGSWGCPHPDCNP